MKFSLLTIITFLLGISFANAQATVAVGSQIEQSRALREIKTQPAAPVGSVYLNDEWTLATIDLLKGTYSDNQIQNVPMKLDLKTNTLELNSSMGIKVLEGSKVEQFYFLNQETGKKDLFVNCNKFKLDGASVRGFCKITGEKISLVSYSSIQFVQANYNAALNMGSKVDEFKKKTSLYLVKDNEFFPANKKNLFALMGDKESEMKNFIKDKKININREEELSSVVEYYDSINWRFK